MARFCTTCGSPMDDAAVFCAKCGKGATGTPPPPGAVMSPPISSSADGLQDNIAGMLAYVTIIPAIIFLVVAPYNRNRFVRFHAFQSLFFALAWFVINVALAFLPFVMSMPLRSLVGLLGLAIWIILLVKAYGGQKWKLPVIGDIAEKQADTI